MKKFKLVLSKIIVTFFGVGKSKLCPGTFGSLATFPLWLLFIIISTKYSLNPFIAIPTFILLIYIIGYYATKIYLEEVKIDDPKEVVIDEVVGQLLSFSISLLFVFFTKNYNILEIQKKASFFFPLYLFITPFLFFRLYDIKKPLLVGKIDREMKNAAGVMLDDVVAGIYAGLTNALLIIVLIKIFF